MRLLKRPEIPIIGLGISILCIVIAVFLLQQTTLTQPTTEKIRIEEISKAVVVVDIEGAVQKPGIYELDQDARLVNALVRAGGLIEQADRYYIAKNMNLSKHVIDEEKIYIPFLIERTDSIETSLSSVRINTATASQLELLPGIGPITTEKIIKNRPYEHIDELVSKKVIGQKTFENIQNLIEL